MSDVTDQIPHWVAFVLAGGSTIVAAVFGIAWTFAGSAYALENELLQKQLEAVAEASKSKSELLAKQLETEKTARETETKELRAKLEELQKHYNDQRVTNATMEGKLTVAQCSLDEQDDVLQDQTALLQKIERKLDLRVADLEARKESKPGMTAVRPAIPRVEPDSDRPPAPRPRLPSRHNF